MKRKLVQIQLKHKHESATTLQKYFRGYLTREKLKMLKSEPRYLIFIGGISVDPYISDNDCSKSCHIIDFKYPTKLKKLSILPIDIANSGAVANGSKIYITGGRDASTIVLLAWDT